MCSSDCEARSMATKQQRVSTCSSDSSVADKKKDGKFQPLQSLSWLHCTTAKHDPSLPRIGVPFERRIFRGYITGFHEIVFSKRDSRKLHGVDCTEIWKQSNMFA